MTEPQKQQQQQQPNPPNPIFFFDTVNAYQHTAAIKAAVELDLFTAIAETDGSAAAVAKRIGAAERGVRILSDFLTICGLLTKSPADRRYVLTADSAAFLDHRSPAYLGGTLEFLLSPLTTEGFDHLAEAVRRGGTATDQGGTTAPDHPIWIRFARAMAPMMAPGAEQLAAMIDPAARDPLRVLDISASHGLWGLSFARRNKSARVTGLDWPGVLVVAKENAAKFGAAERYDTIGGSAFEADLRGPYDLVLLPNFLHHFDAPAITGLLKRLRSALAPGGRVVTVDFIPNDDRVTPPSAAGFAIIMLSHTPGGDAYTFAELQQMFRAAGFARSEVTDLPRTGSRVIVSRP